MGNAVHDFRTPLSSIRVSIEVLRMAENDCERRMKVLGILDQHVSEMERLLERLSREPETLIGSERESSFER